MMNTMFKDLIDTGKVVIYMDDILIFMTDLNKHQELVKKVLQRLQEKDLYAKPKICVFERNSVEFLGLIVSDNQLAMDPIKVAGVTE